jgi:biotin carboxyl carrier protein
VTFWLPVTEQGQLPIAVVADRETRHVWHVSVGAEPFLVTVSSHDGIVLVRPSPDVPASASSAPLAGDADAAPTRYRVAVDRGHQRATVDQFGAGSHGYVVRRAPPPEAHRAGTRHAAGGAATLEAPMPGRVVRIAVATGDIVREHQPLVIVEAMKIEQTVAAPRDGVVAAILCKEGEAVAGGQVLVELAAP